MTKFGTAQPLGRIEDARFLTGTGRYVDDIVPKGALHALFLRSPIAHGRITALDVSAARQVPGVHLVLTADDLLAADVILGMKGMSVTNRDGTPGASPERPVLARQVVRFVGEAVAMVVADSRDAALDALELIDLATEDLPVSVGVAEGGPVIHPEAPGNLAFDWAIGDPEAVETSLAGSAHRLRLRVEHNRVIVNAMEGRAAWAEWDGARLHLCVNGQGVWAQKSELARMLRLPADAVRVTTPDVGGGFGMKSMTYPEYVVIAHAARLLGRPVRWASERTEAMLTDNAGRDLIAWAEIGFDSDHRITAYKVDLVSNLGAYNSQFAQAIQSELFAKVLTGVYDIPIAALSAKGVYTNTATVDAYRGAGRPEAIYTIERAIDHAARVLGADPVDLRRKNLIRHFPYTTATGEYIDVGDFPRVLDRALAEAEAAGFPARRDASAAQGKLRGLGLCIYIEAILGDPSEGARIEFAPDGTVLLFVGTQSNGQGHETVYARFLSERTGLPVGLIRVVQGDSDRIARGGGTGGSRSVTVQTNATIAAVDAMIAAFTDFLSATFDAAEVIFDGGTFRLPGSNRTLTLIEAADLARSRGNTGLLKHEARARIAARSYPNGCHIAEVEVDPDTGAATILRYTVTDDFGNLLNPQLVAGQVHGGIAQGIGQALTENGIYDAQGQLLTASFMDYALPRADDLPFFRFTTEPVPSTGNPLGLKGCGEAGTVGALAAVTNAIRDALAPWGVETVDMPATPSRIWDWLQEAAPDPR
jgi:carbon-monoxide dehydrogenase large subunit